MSSDPDIQSIFYEMWHRVLLKILSVHFQLRCLSVKINLNSASQHPDHSFPFQTLEMQLGITKAQSECTGSLTSGEWYKERKLIKCLLPPCVLQAEHTEIHCIRLLSKLAVEGTHRYSAVVRQQHILDGLSLPSVKIP